MAATTSSSLSSLLPTSHQRKVASSSPSSAAFCSSSSYSPKTLSISLNSSLLHTNGASKRPPIFHIYAELNKRHEPLKVMISGAPASGKGTQCELIVKHHDLVHISAGDLLRAEIASGTENGQKAKEYMTKGELVPNDIIVNMVKERLSQPDAQTKGWLLDGYPRSQSQADAIEAAGLRPDVFILLEVPDNVLVERVVGRRLDPVTGRIYHLTYSPPETQEIAERLTQRFDDTEYQKCCFLPVIRTLLLPFLMAKICMHVHYKGSVPNCPTFFRTVLFKLLCGLDFSCFGTFSNSVEGVSRVNGIGSCTQQERKCKV